MSGECIFLQRAPNVLIVFAAVRLFFISCQSAAIFWNVFPGESSASRFCCWWTVDLFLVRLGPVFVALYAHPPKAHHQTTKLTSARFVRWAVVENRQILRPLGLTSRWLQTCNVAFVRRLCRADLCSSVDWFTPRAMVIQDAGYAGIV